MSFTLFISDVHLHPQRPQIQQIFADFLLTTANKADALYILGDLFEFWLGDDDANSPYNAVLDQLNHLSQSVPVYFIPGNRDFLVGDLFIERSGCQILTEHKIITLYGQQILIMHGDTLCIDDVDYMQFRSMVRSQQWFNKVMAMTLSERMNYFSSLRAESQESNDAKSSEIMDVNQAEVVRVMRQSNIKTLIHGHTHRPGIHHFMVEDDEMTRVVLGDWYEHGNVLYVDENEGYDLRMLK